MVKDDHIERFWARVDQDSTCWEWRGARDPNGYGRVSVKCANGWRTRLAHRVSWTLTHGDPGALCVLHRCDNPSCVRPDHLFLGTQKDNMADCARKGRAVGNRGLVVGEKHGMSKLSWEMVDAIRASDDPQRHLARRFGVHQTLISLVQRRKIWPESFHP